MIGCFNNTHWIKSTTKPAKILTKLACVPTDFIPVQMLPTEHNTTCAFDSSLRRTRKQTILLSTATTCKTRGTHQPNPVPVATKIIANQLPRKEKGISTVKRMTGTRLRACGDTRQHTRIFNNYPKLESKDKVRT